MAKVCKKIVIIDYGLGNIRSLINAFSYLGVKCEVSSKEKTIKQASYLILPGVGDYQTAMGNLNRLNLIDLLSHTALVKKTPILGICLGMQLMCRFSMERGKTSGLGFISSDVTRFPRESAKKIPHVGFNTVFTNEHDPLYTGIGKQSDYYFTHSYRISAVSDGITGQCSYGGNFIASFVVDNLYGVQFHPERSQNSGLQVLKNFIEKS